MLNCRIIFSALALSMIFSGCSSPMSALLGGSKSGANVVWNGEDKAMSSSWSNVDFRDLDKATVQLSDEDAYSGKNAILFKAAGSKWMGFGWTWLSSWDAYQKGFDSKKYKNFSFMFKVHGKVNTTNDGLTLSLSSNNKVWGPSIKFSSFNSGELTNGQWHKVTLPLSALGSNNKAGQSIDMRNIKTMLVGTWAPEYADFNLFIDDIAFEK